MHTSEKRAEGHLNWLALFRVRGKAKPGRNNSPEALVRDSVMDALGIKTMPLGRFDGQHSDCTAHSDLWEIDSSDVEAPSVQKAIAHYMACNHEDRADLGYDSAWFWFFLTRNEGDLIVYAGV